MNRPASDAVPDAPGAADDGALAIARAAFQHARAGDAAALRAVLDLGLPVDARNEKGDSLLMLASYNGNRDAARLLLERGADPALCNDRGQSVLAGAAFKGDAAMVRLLLEHGAPPDWAMPDGKTPLCFAAMFDRVEVIEILLEHGAAADRQDSAGASALDLARGMGAERAATRLVAALQD